MKKRFVKITSILFVFFLVLCFLTCETTKSATVTKDVGTVSITILETSDIHGMLAPWDYASDREYDGGLAKAATVIKQEREKDSQLILLDCGDSMQDNLIQEFRNDKVHPIILAFNKLKYDAWQIGNHEFNFEFENLTKAIKASESTPLAANIYKADGSRFATPYIIKKVKGVNVGIVGFAPTHIPRWEASNPEHFNKMTFVEIGDELGKILSEVKSKCDVIVVLAHYGKDGEYGSEGMMKVAEKYGKDVAAFLIGHGHDTFAKTLDNGSVIAEPGGRCNSLAKVTFDMKNENGKWKLVKANAEIIPIAKNNIAADKEMLSLLSYVDTKSKQIANTVVGKVGADFLPSVWWNDLQGIPTAVIQDTAMIDLINIVQMKETKADVSLAALFDPTSNLTKGDFKKRDGVKVYKYDNTLMAVKITGKQLKTIMERQAGDFFNTAQKGDVTISFNPEIRLYNYDMFAGVTYDIDISKPAGKRIVNVMYKGAPLKDDQKLVLALNNYRYGGLSSSGLISDKSEDLVYNSGKAIRDLISNYVSQQGTIMPKCDNNWKIIGINIDKAKAEKIYQKVRSGEIKIPTSEDGRTPNVKSLNINSVK